MNADYCKHDLEELQNFLDNEYPYEVTYSGTLEDKRYKVEFKVPWKGFGGLKPEIFVNYEWDWEIGRKLLSGTKRRSIEMKICRLEQMLRTV